MNSVEMKQLRSQNAEICRNIINLCKTEVREMTEDEKEEFDKAKAECERLNAELKALQDKLNSYEAPEEGEEENPKEDEEETKNKSNRNIMKNKSIVKEIRSAIENGTLKFNLGENRAATVAGFTTGEGDSAVKHETTVVDEEYKSILEPLYADSVINKLGATIYSGMPMGDIAVPVMSKNTVGWAGEIASAGSTQNEFTTVTLHPKRLTAYVDISKMLIATDTLGVEAAIRRDIVNALNDKFESTILSADAKTDTKPAGLFNGASETTISTFANICDLEAELEDTGVGNDLKYVMNPKVKAFMRNLAKSSKHTELVYQNGEVDGTPAISTSLVPSKKFAYGNFKDFIVGLWDNVEVTVDPYSQAVNGCIRLVINMYADAVLARTAGIKFGNIA